MNKISTWVRDYFAFSPTEMRGSVVLLFLTATVVAASALWSAHLRRPPEVSAHDWQTLDSLVALLDSAMVRTPPVVSPTAPFLFNPNEADSSTLTQLGLPPRIARRVVRYRAKGGVFRRRADFKKIYGLPEATYRRLYDFIDLPEARPPRTKRSKARHVSKVASSGKPTYPRKPKRRISVDINTADTTQLQRLPGIGSKLSARIVKYRQVLGGYHRVDQLREVYHMTDRGIASLQESAYVAPGNHPRRININRSDAAALAKHPYISWEIARAVVAHRQDYGEYRSLDDLREVYLMTPKLFEKISPYLEI